METGKNGISSDTPKNILFGAGTIHKNLKYTKDASGSSGSWNFNDSIMGATNGGSKFSIKPEYVDLAIDGANVLVKGLKKKTGETAEMEINFAELTKEIIKTAASAADGVSEDELYDLIESKADIAEGDYFDNIAFVGKTLDGRNIIAILPNAFCTSGLETEGKSKEGAVGKYTFACHADITADTFDKLPWKIYYPKAVV